MIINIMLNAIHKEGDRYTSRALTPGLSRPLAGAHVLAIDEQEEKWIIVQFNSTEKVKMIKQSFFKPAWWLPGPHLQTLWPVFSWAKKKPTTTRQRLELADGDFIDLDWVNQNLNVPIIVILHGLEGSSHSHYVRDILYTLQQLNYRSVLMHFRGCSGEMNRKPRYYHSGDTADLQCVIEMLQQCYPQTPLGAIGYSLGGNVLLKTPVMS